MLFPGTVKLISITFSNDLVMTDFRQSNNYFTELIHVNNLTIPRLLLM